MPREPHTPEPGDDTLDRLLAMSSDPPQLEPDARERLLARLQASRSAELTPPAATRGRKAPMSPSSPPRSADHSATTTAAPPPPSPPSRLRVPGYALAIAASGLLIWGATSFELPGGPEDPDAPVPQASLDELRNDDARPRQVTLADGTTVLLRRGAALRQDGPRALHLLQGEALIEVAPDPVDHAPFTITSAAGKVTVLGTKFLLREAAGELMAGVLRGELKLVSGGGEALLQAGEVADMAPGAAPIKRPAERLSHEVAWARDAMKDASEDLKAVRRGNLIARFPTWPGEHPLPLRRMDVDVYVEDGVARTTIDQTFFNHTDYQLEGVYSFPLPSDAAISRLAMYVDGKLMEAGITERQEGREIYESIVYRRRDPALLEWMQGNEFRMRVFPLPGRTEKRILLSYTQPLAGLYGDYSVRVPIPELDLPVGTLRYRVHVKDRTLSVDSCCVDLNVHDEGDERIAEATLTDVKIGEDLALTLYPTQKPPAVTTAAMADPGGDYFMVRARPELPGVSQHTARRWVVLHDTSASRSPAELAAQTRFLRHLLRELDEADRVSLLAFDSTVRPLPGGFSRVDQLDLPTVDNFLAREGRDHVGASDLGLAVDQALALLDADAGPEAPHILYLGDGILSTPGDAPRKALRDRLAAGGSARATFVAAALGDENDLPLLDDLATATGGLRVQLTAGADLRWQALDLAAALNTARVHQLRARLLDAGDKPLPGEPMLSASAAADGESVVILSRGTGASGQVPKAMLLEGQLGGAAWSQRVELPAARPDAGYLPRLWARARVAADIAAGAEAHQKEITDLGLEHFLVTPFTSLLVLENEAMYRQFKVRRPDAHGWAHYPAPAEIKVVHEPRGAATALPGQLVLRQPIDLVGLPPQYGGDEFEFSEGGGFGGLGLWGTGRGGGGTGEGTIGLGLTGLIGKGGGGGTGSGYGRGAGAGFGGRGTRVPAVRMGDISFGPTQPDVASSLDSRFVTGRELAKRSSWSRVDDSELKNAESGRPVASGATAATTRSARFMPSFGGETRRTRSAGSTISQRAQPLALNYIGDPRLGDLGEHVPALFEDGFDRQRERLLAATAAVAEGEISPAARELLTRAREALTPARYAVDGGVLAIEPGGRFTRSRRIGGYLDELVRYDGAALIASYPELGLAVERRVGLAEPALLAEWVPWLLPAPDALARWYVVSLHGERTLRLQQRDSDEFIDLELDPQLRVVSVTRRKGDQLLGQTRFEYDARGLTIIADDQRTRVELTTAAPIAASDAALTTLTLPLRADADLATEVAELGPEDPRWRALQRERIASLAALGQSGALAPIVAEMRAQAPLTRGELVLAGAGIVADPDKKLDAELARSADPVAAYLSALRRARKNQTAPLEQVAKAHPGTLVGMLASYDRLLLDVPRGINPQSIARLKAFIADYHHADLAYVAAQQLAGNYYWRSPGAAAPAWEAVAAAFPEHRPAALHAAGTAYQYTGNWALAGERFEEGLAAAVDGGQVPVIDWSVRAAIERGGGQAGWRMQWSRWRDVVQKSGDADLLAAFLAAAQMMGDPGEVHRAIAGADLEHLDPDGGARLTLTLVRAGLPADAQAVLRPLLLVHPEHPGLLALAAILAEHTGDLRSAAELGDRALASESELPLTRLRAAYRSLFDLRARVATTRDLPKKPGDRDPLDLALDVAARWRAEDPDNPEIDERCATLLFSVGQPAEAMRHLESIVERHPAEGASHARVARMLEREGRLDEADLQWQQATAVEPTDPSALIGRAHNRLAAGDAAVARALIDDVLAGKWQDRFWQAKQQATSIKAQLDARTP